MALQNNLSPSLFPLSWKDTSDNLTGYWRELRPFREERLSPCRAACPAGEDIPAYIGLALKGNYEESFFKITDENPLPAICGRVCFHPCEESCLRAELDGPVSIHRVERFIGDYGLSRLKFVPLYSPKKRNVAVVGSGPAGLSAAYHARRLGYAVTLFEAESKLGGLLRYGIPSYRLPKKVLNRSLNMILELGLAVETEFRLGEGSSWKRLDSFDALFLALGAHKSVIPPLKGLSLSPQMIGGLEFLKGVNQGLGTLIGRRVAVMGGGNTAIDAARVCRRLGATKVFLLYRRSRKEMPANPDEVRAALKEGVQLIEQALPIQVDSLPNGKLKIVWQRTEPTVPDSSGRIIYRPVQGSESESEMDQLILAVGQTVAFPSREGVAPIDLDGIEVTPFLRWGQGKFFAGGDVVPGPRRVCDAIGAGKLGALSIHCYLEGVDVEEIWPRIQLGRGNAFSMNDFLRGFGDGNPRLKIPVERNEIKLDLFHREPPADFPCLPTEEALKGFKEVVGEVEVNELDKTAARCLSCGTCTGCDICYQYCPDLSVIKKPHGYEINYDYCKGCAICAEECPRGIIHTQVEEG